MATVLASSPLLPQFAAGQEPPPAAGAFDPQDRSLLDTYCADLERALSGAQDCSSFLERVAALDQRYLDTWFVQRFGAANVDPMQAFRQPPACGVVWPAPGAPGSAAMPAPSTSFGLRAAELYQRHLDLLDSGRRACPSPSKPPSRPTAVAAGGASPCSGHMWPQPPHRQACWPYREELERAWAPSLGASGHAGGAIGAGTGAGAGVLWPSAACALGEAERPSAPNLAPWCLSGGGGVTGGHSNCGLYSSIGSDRGGPERLAASRLRASPAVGGGAGALSFWPPAATAAAAAGGRGDAGGLLW